MIPHRHCLLIKWTIAYHLIEYFFHEMRNGFTQMVIHQIVKHMTCTNFSSCYSSEKEKNIECIDIQSPLIFKVILNLAHKYNTSRHVISYKILTEAISILCSF